MNNDNKVETAIAGLNCWASYATVWYGMVWYGMVWYGMVWYGMVWYGISSVASSTI